MSRNTLTNETWSRLLPILKQLGIYRKKNLRKTVEGILFRLRTGCQWADIPSYFGKANSQIKGRKRHIAVDTLGNLLSVVVHAANIHDTKAGIFVAKKAFETYPSLKGFCADAGYRNTFEREVSEQLGLTVEISKRIQDISWHILPKRWIVERTFAWLGWSRRLAKDFEQTNLSAENFVKLGYISQILRFIK